MKKKFFTVLPFLIYLLFYLLNFTNAASSSVILNEIMWGKDQDGEEWVELRNLNNKNINLAGWILDNAKSSGKDLEIERGIIPAKGYFLICDNTSKKDYCDFYAAISLSNNYKQNGRLVLRNKKAIVDQTPDSEKWPAGDRENISMARVFKGSEVTNLWVDNNPPSPQSSGILLEANAGSSIISLTGKEITFNASSSKGNIKEYIWNFGDGATAEGKVVSYRYSLPGRYIVSLTISDGRNEKSHNIEVIIYSSSIFISEFSLTDKWIEVVNESEKAQDISGWGISDKKDKIKFKFSKGSYISPHSFILLQSNLTSSIVKKKGGIIFLFYPSGDIKQQISYKEFDGSVVRKDNNYFYSGLETPGAGNVISGAEVSLEEEVNSSLVSSSKKNLDLQEDSNNKDENKEKPQTSFQQGGANSPLDKKEILSENLLAEIKSAKNPLIIGASIVTLFSGFFGLGLVRLRRRLKEGILSAGKIEVKIENN
ncbi:MAG: lamin tail domain-containing protein [Candidatus Pacebacteria bacterium]|nr:lamin tail domain-containing protein [Candidatus Paceibacterota bacterium]